jgi:Cu(I)/Ag(I) efflux system periplasmic protein CusF
VKSDWFDWVTPAIVTVAGVAVGFVALPGSSATASKLQMIAQADKPTGQGTLNSVDGAARKLNITHGQIAALNWPAMTMDFDVAPGVDLKALKAGSKISFTLARGADGMYVIDEVKPAQ